MINNRFVNKIYDNLRSAPIELIIYALFSIIAIVLYWTLPILLSDVRFYEITGGVISIIGYMFGLFFNFMLIFVKRWTFSEWTSNLKVRKKNIRFIINPLIIQLIGGILLTGLHFNNPYHKMSFWQPILLIVLPVAWIVILIYSRINTNTELSVDNQQIK